MKLSPLRPWTLVLLTVVGFTAQAATRTWNNAAGGDWSLAANWSPAAVPAAGDDVVITLDGNYTVTLAADATVASLTLGGASGRATLALQGKALTTRGTVTSHGTLQLNGGSLNGQLTVEAGGELELGGTASKYLYQLVLLNQGTVRWTGGDMYGGQNPTTLITNVGLWEITTDSTFTHWTGAEPSQFINLGTVRKGAGTGTAALSLHVTTTGQVIVDQGKLALGGPVALASVIGGDIQVAEGAGLDLSGTSFVQVPGQCTGAGVSALRNGTLLLQTDILPGLVHAGGAVAIGPDFQQSGTITNLTLSGSTLVGTNRVGAGTLLVTAGGLSGQLTVEAGGELELGGTASKYLYQLVLLNQGTVRWTGGDMYGGQNPTTLITNVGLWEITTDSTFTHWTGAEPSQFINLGTVRKGAGTGTAAFSGITFANGAEGVIEPQDGTLALPAAYVHSQGLVRLGGGTIQAGTSLAFTGGTLEGHGTVRGSTADNLLLTPGTNGPGTVSFTAGLGLSSSTTLRIDAGGTGAGQHDQLAVTGLVSLGGSVLELTNIAAVPVGSTMTLISNDGTDPVEGTFKDLADGALFEISRQLFRIYYRTGSGNDVAIVRDDGGARLTGLGMTTNSFFELKGLGTNYATYTIEASVDFTNWVTIGSSIADPSGLFFHFDSNAFEFPMRFYRSFGP